MLRFLFCADMIGGKLIDFLTYPGWLVGNALIGAYMAATKRPQAQHSDSVNDMKMQERGIRNTYTTRRRRARHTKKSVIN